MKIKRYLSLTHIEDSFNLRVDEDFYNATRDNDKEINYVIVQSNGVVIIHTKKKKGKNNAL